MVTVGGVERELMRMLSAFARMLRNAHRSRSGGSFWQGTSVTQADYTEYTLSDTMILAPVLDFGPARSRFETQGNLA
jgi:hypothetical protein